MSSWYFDNIGIDADVYNAQPIGKLLEYLGYTRPGVCKGYENDSEEFCANHIINREAYFDENLFSLVHMLFPEAGFGWQHVSGCSGTDMYEESTFDLDPLTCRVVETRTDINLQIESYEYKHCEYVLECRFMDTDCVDRLLRRSRGDGETELAERLARLRAHMQGGGHEWVVQNGTSCEWVTHGDTDWQEGKYRRPGFTRPTQFNIYCNGLLYTGCTFGLDMFDQRVDLCYSGGRIGMTIGRDNFNNWYERRLAPGCVWLDIVRFPAGASILRMMNLGVPTGRIARKDGKCYPEYHLRWDRMKNYRQIEW